MVFRMRAHTHKGWAHRQRVSTTFLSRKTLFFLCSWRDSNPRPLDLRFNALTTEPTHHPVHNPIAMVQKPPLLYLTIACSALLLIILSNALTTEQPVTPPLKYIEYMKPETNFFSKNFKGFTEALTLILI